MIRYSLVELINECQREIGFREKTYPRYVAQHKLTPANAEAALNKMAQIKETLEALERRNAREFDQTIPGNI